jgi:hypothetical protein
VNLPQLIFDLIDFRSFSNLWYWIALAVTWSTASHWVLGVPFDMVLRARRQGGEAMIDLEDIVRVNVNRMLFIVGEAGLVILAILSCVLTILAITGFYYEVEFCQAIFLLLFPLSGVWLHGTRTAARIRAEGLSEEELCRQLNSHRIFVQIIGVFSILITAMWGMLQNFNLSPIH